MMKNSISMRLLLLVVSLNLACGLSQPLSKKSDKVPDRQVEKNRSGRDAYLIYSTVINNLPKNKAGYVICGRTTTVPFFPYKSLSESIKNLFQDANKTINSEVLTSFLMENKESVDLEARFKLYYPYTLISPEKLSKVFEDGGWENFRRLFPGRSTISLSSIGYSSEGGEALVYLGKSAGYKSGSGDYYVLKKQGTNWVIVSEVNVWLS